MYRKKGFSLVELSVVLVVIGILMSLGGVVFKQILEFASFKRCTEAINSKNREFMRTLPFTSVKEIEGLMSCLKPEEYLLLPDFLERFYPDPCQYSPELLPSYISPPPVAEDTLRKERGVVFALVASCERGKTGKVILDDYRVKARRLFPVSVSRLKNEVCSRMRGAEAAIASLQMSGHVVNSPVVKVSSVIPPGYRLKVISPKKIEVMEKVVSEFSVPLNSGVNLLTFILTKNGKEVYRRTEYVAFFVEGESSGNSLVEGVFRHGNEVTIKFRGRGKALIDFGDGKVLFLPVVGNNLSVRHSYLTGSFNLRVYTESGGRSALFERKIEVEEGAESPELQADIEENGDFWIVRLHANGGEKLSCLVFENTLFLSESENCRELTLRYDKNASRLLSILLKKDSKPAALCNILEKEGEMVNLGCATWSP